MLGPSTHLRTRADIPSVEYNAYRCRQHLGALAAQGDPHTSQERGFGALRVFDDVVIGPGSRIGVEAHDGLEIVLFVLQGECRVEDDLGEVTALRQDAAVCALLGRGIRHHLCNQSPTAMLHIIVAAIVAPVANPPPRLQVGLFAHETPGIVWFASHDAEERAEGAILLDSASRMGIATLDPGVEYVFPQQVERGIYMAILEGQIEFGPSSRFIDGGGDARSRLDSAVRIQGVSRSRVVVVEVPLGFARQLM
jgi:hypothetical protein